MELNGDWIAELRSRTAEIGAADSFNDATNSLEKFAHSIGFPMIGWAPNVSRPVFDQTMDDFMRRQGWPDDILSLWWDKTLMMKIPLYIRCRSTSMPFLTVLKKGQEGIGADGRWMQERMLEMGLHTLITVPIHMPLGGVAKITFAGKKSCEHAQLVVSLAKPELVSVGHLFIDAYKRKRAIREKTDQEMITLTPKEWECLRLSAQGHRVREIAEVLEVKPSTIRFHLQNITNKLRAPTHINAVAIATQLGLIDSILE